PLGLRRPRRSPVERAIKGVLDVWLAAILVVVLAPLVAVMAIWQWHAGSPLTIAHTRVLGRNLVAFDLLRFRSSAPFQSDLLCKLPGLLNVLRGQLSLVGPRAMSEDEGKAPGGMPLTPIQPGRPGPWRQAADPREPA